MLKRKTQTGKSRLMKSLIAITASAVLVSCAAVGPDYTPPQIQLPQHYAFLNSAELENAAFERWWTVYNDAALNQYMDQGLTRNLNIKIAQERLVEAQAQYRAAAPGAAQASGSAGLQALRRQAGAHSEIATLNANYVFDLFGGFSRRREQALAQLEATSYSEQTVRLAYQAELVAAYIDARFFQASIAIANRSIRNRNETLKLIEQRREVNEATELENSRAVAELALQRANIPAFEIGFNANAVRLATLLAAPSAQIVSELRKSYDGIPIPRKGFQPGVPANLLRNRPDILTAERTLAAQMAAVGVSEAQLYPSLSIGGSIRIDADNSLQVGPAINIPVLDRPRLLANRDAAVSRARQAELQWQVEVRDAIGEVEEVLSRQQNRLKEIKSLRKASRSYRRLNTLSRDVFGLGATTLFEMLDAEDDLTQTDTRLAQAHRAYATAIAELAVATGRGARVGEASAAKPVQTAAITPVSN